MGDWGVEVEDSATTFTGLDMDGAVRGCDTGMVRFDVFADWAVREGLRVDVEVFQPM